MAASPDPPVSETPDFAPAYRPPIIVQPLKKQRKTIRIRIGASAVTPARESTTEGIPLNFDPQEIEIHRSPVSANTSRDYLEYSDILAGDGTIDDDTMPENLIISDDLIYSENPSPVPARPALPFVDDSDGDGNSEETSEASSEDEKELRVDLIIHETRKTLSPAQSVDIIQNQDISEAERIRLQQLSLFNQAREGGLGDTGGGGATLGSNSGMDGENPEDDKIDALIASTFTSDLPEQDEPAQPIEHRPVSPSDADVIEIEIAPPDPNPRRSDDHSQNMAV